MESFSSCPEAQVDYFFADAERFDPSQEKFRYMLRLVAYDIKEPKRLRKVAKICQDFGFRIEYSVFECDLEETVFADFWAKLVSVIDKEMDLLIAYRICASCVSEITSIGVVRRPGKVLAYVI